MTEEKDDQEVTIRLPHSILKQIDRIVTEKGLTRQKIIHDILVDRFSTQDDWLDDLIR